ncbi:MAG: hypothetical protein M1837_002765 [Sclerophora amabilis]|nr:MAG: hypothetical protein M1837_002765 [Sclerophora amabilis]
MVSRTEDDVVLLRRVRNEEVASILTAPLSPSQRIKTHKGIIWSSELLGKRARDVVETTSGTRYRISYPTLGEYIELTPRKVTPIYPVDANLIVTLLDIHVSPPTPLSAPSEPPLQILEAGTGHGGLTIHLAKAIHAANTIAPPAPPFRLKSGEQAQQPSDDRPDSGLPIHSTSLADQDTNISVDETAEDPRQREFEEWRKSRRAVIHTLDISSIYSSHAQSTIRGFRQGLYSPHIDFHVGDLSSWVSMQLESHSTRPFLAHAILDLPGSQAYLGDVTKAVQPDGIVMMFCPSITQITAAVQKAKNEQMPLYLDKVVELGAGAGVGGREWNVRFVRPRAVVKAELKEMVERAVMKEGTATLSRDTGSDVEETKVEGDGGFDEGKTSKPDGLTFSPKEAEDDKENNSGIEEDSESKSKTSSFEMICRPKVGARIAGGGFLGVWRKTRS